MKVIHELKGPALLLAGPGTGKTYTLGLRLKYLIENQGVDPNEITVITFTSDAAKNMRTRISDPEKKDLFLPYKKQPKNIITMHSLGFKIIKSYPDKVGLQKTIKLIPDDFEKRILLGDAAQLSGYDRSIGADTANCRQIGKCEQAELPKCEVCETYKTILRKCSSVDYDEQILLAVEILVNNPEILKEIKSSTKHLLVDEYQDINSAQHKLIRLLCREQEDGLFVVGDDDQSIYSWRGGSPLFIRGFKNDYGDKAKVIPLKKSWRCHSNILEGSLNVVENFDNARLEKEPFEYEVEDGPKIQIHNAPSDKKEANIVRAIVQSALPSQDVLILVPQRTFSEAISEELRANQISFSTKTTIPGVGLPLLSRLNDWLANPSDSIALRLCMEFFIDRIGSEVPSKRVRKKQKKQERLVAFSVLANLWRNILNGETDSLWSSLKIERDNDELYSSLHEAFEFLLHQFSTQSDINTFISSISSTLSPWRGIKSFLGEVVAWVDMNRQYSPDGSDYSVRIMSFQGAKGLEAKVVCVLGLEEGVIPRIGEDLSEQSRLLFVSMTRAINELHLFHARIRSSGIIQRNVFQKDKPDVQRSRFLGTIPKKFVENIYHPS